MTLLDGSEGFSPTSLTVVSNMSRLPFMDSPGLVFFERYLCIQLGGRLRVQRDWQGSVLLLLCAMYRYVVVSSSGAFCITSMVHLP